MAERREYGSGSVFQRHLPTCPPQDPETKKRPKHKCAGRWVGTIESGTTKSGARKRTTVSGKTEAAVKMKIRDAAAAKRRGEETSSRMTVKKWAGEYLAIRILDLAPKAYNAAENPIRRWVVPTIGHKQLADLTPKDIRAVADAQRKAGRQPADTHRAMMTMLNHAVAEGHAVPLRVLKVESPKSPKSDRQAMTVDEGLRCLAAAADRPDGSRWLFTLLYGARQGECIGLTWDALDFDAEPFGEAVLEWQLQALPYIDPKNKALGFRVPEGHESKHLVRGYHLVRPKSKAGWRVAPLLEPVRDAMLRWREVAPDSPHGLVWPRANGEPRNDKHDRAEWWALQEAAGVRHPTRTILVDGEPQDGYYHVHECRNFAATMLLEAGVPEHVVTDLLGHSSVATSLRYRTVRREPLLDAMTKVGERLQLG